MFKIRCNHCGNLVTVPQPTDRQIEAYRLVRIHQCTHKEAGIMLGVSRSAVSHLISRLQLMRPDLFCENALHVTPVKIITFDDKATYGVKKAF